MDPYLEDRRVWEDFHTTFLVALRAALKPQLPPDFVARLERRECLKTEIREVFLEVRRVREPGEVVTVIELLSPANKESGRGREEYLRKQPDLALDLQAVFTRAYDDGPTETLDYTKPCAPPLSDTDALWAKSLSPAGSK